jgi:hypothetical protein
MRPRRRSFFVSSAKLPSHILTIWTAQVVQDHQGVQPELPAAARYCPLQRHAAARNPCPRTAPRQRRPGSPLPAAPGRGPSPAHTARVRARPYPVPGNPRRVRAPGPAQRWAEGKEELNAATPLTAGVLEVWPRSFAEWTNDPAGHADQSSWLICRTCGDRWNREPDSLPADLQQLRSPYTSPQEAERARAAHIQTRHSDGNLSRIL